jgi:hypothetical protein
MPRLIRTPNQLRFSWRSAFRLGFALLCLAGSGGFVYAASAGLQSWPTTSTQVASQFAIADFDGDKQPDLATVHAGQSSSWSTLYWIAFQLSGGSRHMLGITAPTGGLRITSRDVNGDDFLDVVVMTAWTNRPVAVLLNDGRGNFSASSPSAFPAAFTTSEESWASITNEIKDATVLLLSRNLTGSCPQRARFSSPQNVRGLLVFGAAGNSLSPAVLSFLGRAPPFSHFHVQTGC